MKLLFAIVQDKDALLEMSLLKANIRSNSFINNRWILTLAETLLIIGIEERVQKR